MEAYYSISTLRTTGRAQVPLIGWDHILEGAACSLPVAKNSLIVFCPICELLLTTIHLPHFLCQFPKLKKYHVEIYSKSPTLPEFFSAGFQHHHGNFQSAQMLEPAGRVFGARLWEAQVEHIWNNGLAREKKKTPCPPVCASSAHFNPSVTF